MRITNKKLNEKIDLLNQITNSPATPWSKVGGKLVANVGNYHLYEAYGGACVHRMANKGGGVTTPVCCGHITKRELFKKLISFCDGIETGKKLSQTIKECQP